MKQLIPLLFFNLAVWASSSAPADSPSLTVYAASTRSSRYSPGYDESKGGFALVRETVPLAQQGENDVLAPPVSPMLDPACIMLRDPSGKSDFRILEQKFRANVLTEQAMLARFEGQTIPFQVHEGDKVREVTGKIVSLLSKQISESFSRFG